MDDCSLKFGHCTHNGRQTHYHCLQMGCDKVYISTSDVQMHANYHRKDSAIIMEGFQRFRATEDCGTPSCQFYGQRTTHFHCRRTDCQFTFKNKADMEKHKSYHQKDEVLGRDGFKKFMKYEHCSYKGCRFSKISNHIHCIRPGCFYVLHSTAQLYSHKRKHERRDFENAYRNFRQKSGPSPSRPPQVARSLQAVPVSPAQSQSLSSPPMASMSLPVKMNTDLASSPPPDVKPDLDDLSSGSSSPVLDLKVIIKQEPGVPEDDDHASAGIVNRSINLSEEKLSNSLSLPIPSSISPQKETKVVASPIETSPSVLNGVDLSKPSQPSPEKRERDETWKAYLIRYTANDPCNSRCHFLYKDHYHCRVDGCQVLFRSKDGVREHAKFHEIQDRITPLVFLMYEEQQACPQNCLHSLNEKHYHCNWTGCSQFMPHSGPAFARLEHYRIHEYAKASFGKGKIGNSKDDEFSKRRRGRPPKYPKNEIPSVPKVELPDAIIQESVQLYSEGKFDPSAEVVNGFKHFCIDEMCPDSQCIYYAKDHFHCARPRCHHTTDRMDVLNLHAKDFHNFVTILDGFEFFDRNIDCRRQHCHNNRANRHFHCMKPKCDYSFVRHSTMMQHDRKHNMPVVSKIAPFPAVKDVSSYIPIVPAIPGLQMDPKNKNIIKAAGTFYPLSPVLDVRGSIQANIFTQPLVSLALSSNLSAHAVSTALANNFASQMVSSSLLTDQLTNQLAAQTLPSSMNTFIPLMNGGQIPLRGAIPLSVLLQQQKDQLMAPFTNWSAIRSKMHCGHNQNCGRPFCKLKKVDHYHCLECNQAFSDPARLRCHMSKHGMRFKGSESSDFRIGKPVPLMPKPSTVLDLSNNGNHEDEIESDFDEEDDDSEFDVAMSSSLNLNPESFANVLHAQRGLGESDENSNDDEDGNIVVDEEDEEEEDLSRGDNSTEEVDNNQFDDSLEEHPLVVDENPEDRENMRGEDEDESIEAMNLSRRSGRKRTVPKHQDFIDSDVVVAKQMKLSSPPSGVKDVNVPEGFTKYRTSVDCQHAACSYRLSMTHYHCNRDDCGYGFNDRTRFIQHLMRHDRLDNIMGSAFLHFRSSVSCKTPNCDLSVKSSHFHCLKCPFTCADSSKVPAHRKFHQKMESIASNGFQKFTGNEDCMLTMCSYYRKQTHYHCTYPACNHSVLGPAQMAAHKIKHPQEELN